MTLKIQECNVARVLIDGGSSADIIFYLAFNKLWLSNAIIKTSSIDLLGFEWSSTKPKVSITLEVTAVGKTLNVEFLTVQTRSPYNAILGRNWIHVMEGVPSTLHQVMQFFSTDGNRIVEIRRDQTMAQDCYNIAMKQAKSKRKKNTLLQKLA